MSRHAYCIIAHNDPYCLQALVNMIDDDRNDIFIILDKKANYRDFLGIKTDKGRLIAILYGEQSIDMQWGDMSLVQAELLVFKTALQHGPYEYLHLLSGQDLPLKAQDCIHKFFDSLAKGTNLVGFGQGELNKKYLSEKTDYYYFFTGKCKYPVRYIRGIFTIYRSTIVSLQKIIGFKRRWDIKLYRGYEWVSITSGFAQFLVDSEKWILRKFRWVPCADEIYKQTLIMASPYKDTVYDITLNFAGKTRKIDWTRGKPYTWHDCDFEELVDSRSLFARKFSTYTDNKIIDRLQNHIINNGKTDVL